MGKPTARIPRAYLAGPDVFHPEHPRIFAQREFICRRSGLDPLVPVDNDATTALEIYRSNVRHLERCDLVIANITPFRGPHCDVGTAWEVGYATSRGVPVFAFSEVRAPLLDRIPSGPLGRGVDASGMTVEDFGLCENLMIVRSLVDRVVHVTFEAAVEAAARYLGTARQ